MPPTNTATKTPNLPARRQPDRLPSTMAALAAIPEEEIWLQKQKSARTRRACRRDVAHFSARSGSPRAAPSTIRRQAASASPNRFWPMRTLPRPGFAPARGSLGTSLMAKGELEPQHCRAGSMLDPRHHQTAVNLGMIYYSQGDSARGTIGGVLQTSLRPCFFRRCIFGSIAVSDAADMIG